MNSRWPHHGANDCGANRNKGLQLVARDLFQPSATAGHPLPPPQPQALPPIPPQVVTGAPGAIPGYRPQPSLAGTNNTMSSSESDCDNYEAGERDRQNRRRKPMSFVNLPNGDRRKIVTPARACHHTNAACDFAATLILLRPEGRMARREYRIISKQMKATIVQHQLQEQGGGRFTSYDIVSIQKINNACLWQRFREKQKQIAQEVGYVNEKMLFHGTPNAEVIIKYGFDRKKANPTGMFGPRIYFAEHSSKSNQYAYGYLGGNGCPSHRDRNCYVCPRKVLLCRVSLGKTSKKTTADKTNNTPAGHHSYSGVPAANGLRYPEYAVDHEDQVYPEFLITYKIVQ